MDSVGSMKQLYYGQAKFLVGDEVADTLLEYAAALAQHSSADTLVIRVLGPDGNEESTELLLTQSTMMTAVSTRSQLQEPDNIAAIVTMRERMSALAPMHQRVVADDQPPPQQFYDEWDDRQ